MTEKNTEGECTWGGLPCRYSREHMRYLFENDLKSYNRELRRMCPDVPDIEYTPRDNHSSISTLLGGAGIAASAGALLFFGRESLPIKNDSLEFLIYTILPMAGIFFGCKDIGRYIGSKIVKEMAKEDYKEIMNRYRR